MMQSDTHRKVLGWTSCDVTHMTGLVLPAVQLLGRADQVSDFVRKGSSEGYTEIHLSSGQARPIIIKRCMSSAHNSTEWYLNGASPFVLTIKCLTHACNTTEDQG